MLEAIATLFRLKWTTEPKIRPLPTNVSRVPVPTPSGDLELLVSEPLTSDDKPSAPILFVHGGFGSAGVWLEWMTYLQPRYGGHTYAGSLRGHGGSYALSFWRLVWGTSLDDLAGDLVALVAEVRRREGGRDPVLVGHSAGGGLSQYVLAQAERDVRTPGLVLLGAMPHYGNLDVYGRWFLHDQWFPLRLMLHLQHPASPLSTPRLVHAAFFGPEYPLSSVPAFMRWMSDYESMGWPLGLGGSWARWLTGRKNVWLDADAVVENIARGARPGSDKVCVMCGDHDMMFSDAMRERQVCEYQRALARAGGSEPKSGSGSGSNVAISDKTGTGPVELADVGTAGQVQLALIKGAGHHVQNDVQRDAGAEVLRQFVLQL